MNSKPILVAQIDDKVRRYWLVLTLIICLCGVISILLLPLIVPIVLVASKAYLKALSVELFERKLSVKKGVFVKVEKSVPLEKITDISMVQGPLMRAFNLYTLNVETAGQSGEGALVSIIGIIDAEQFREKVLAQKDLIAGSVQTQETQQTDADPLLTSVQNIEAMLKDILDAKKSGN